MSLEDLTTEQLLAHARAGDERNRLFNSLLNSPDTREDALRLVKKANPTMPIPELDSTSKLEARLAEERKAREDLEKKVQEDQIRDRIDRERARCMKKYELTEAEISEIETTIMMDKEAPIPHYDAACKVYKASKVQATPTPAVMTRPKWEMPEKDVWKEGIGNRMRLNQIADEQAYVALNEIRAGRRAA